MQQQDIKTTYATPNSTAPKLAPQKAMSFGEAFAQARKAGSNEFTWNGKKFNTDLKTLTDIQDTSNYIIHNDNIESDWYVISDIDQITKMLQDLGF